MNKYTGFKDKNNKKIYLGDILYNGFVGDLWIVEYRNNEYTACLIPNSGFIGHPKDAKYPYQFVEVETIKETFERVGSINNKNRIAKQVKELINE
jgi:hypothetical protein